MNLYIAAVVLIDCICMYVQNKYDIQKICACEITDDRNAQRVVFRIIRVGKEDGAYKHLDFEAPVAMASEW